MTAIDAHRRGMIAALVAALLLVTPREIPAQRRYELTPVLRYSLFLGTLDSMNRESIPAASKEFQRQFGSAPAGDQAEAFRLFLGFYRNTVRTCDMLAFRDAVPEGYERFHRYRKDFQSALHTISSADTTSGGVADSREKYQRDPLDSFEDMDDNVKKRIENRHALSLRELRDYRRCGIRFILSEGDWYIAVDPLYLEKAATELKGEYGEFIRFSASESMLRMADDAALLVTWEELRNRIIRRERFARSHPDIPETEKEILPGLRRWVQWYLVGIDNTRAYDIVGRTGTGKLDPGLKNSYEAFLAENRDSGYLSLVADVYEIAKRNGFVYNKELNDFLKSNGFGTYGDEWVERSTR